MKIMWRCIFNNETKRGVDCGREPLNGEFSIDLSPEHCDGFANGPDRYQYVNGTFGPVDPAILGAEDLEKQRRVMKMRVRAERDARKAGGIKNNNIWYASDLESRHVYLEWKDTGRDMLAAGSLPADNLIVDGDTVLFESLDELQADRVVKIAVAYDLVEKSKALDRKLSKNMKAHIAAINVSTDPLNYDFSVGWPAKY